jgi:hypothetical protein
MFSPTPRCTVYGNDYISSEKYFENSKTERGAGLIFYYNFVHIFEFYLVTQSLSLNNRTFRTATGWSCPRRSLSG